MELAFQAWTKPGSLAAEQSPDSCNVLGTAATEPTVSLLRNWHTTGLANATMGTEAIGALALLTPYNNKNGRFNQTH